MSHTILIADDNQLVRQALCEFFDREDDFDVCGEAGDGREAVAKAEELHPDLILLDLSMPLMNGLEATRILKGLMPRSAVLDNDPQPRRLLQHRKIDSAETKTRQKNVEAITHMLIVQCRNCLSQRVRTVGVSPAVVQFGMRLFDRHLQWCVCHGEGNEIKPVPRSREPSRGFQPLV